MDSSENQLLTQLSVNMNLATYPESLRKFIQCTLCSNLLLQPKLCLECNQNYCSKCFTINNQTCLKCKKKDSFIDSIGLSALLNEGTVKCPSEYLCREELTYEQLISHIKICPYIRIEKCTFCSYSDISPQLYRHLVNCPERKTKCEFCDDIFLHSNINLHNAICEFRLLQCEICGENYRYNKTDHDESTCLKKSLIKTRNDLQNEIKKRDGDISKLSNELLDLRNSLIGKKIQRNESSENLGELTSNRYRRYSRKPKDYNFRFAPNPKELQLHEGKINHMIKIENNKYKNQMATAGEDKMIKIWDFSDQSISSLIGHNSGVNFLLQILKNLDNVNILSCDLSGIIKHWDLDKKECVRTIHFMNKPLYGLAEFNVGLIASAGLDKSIILWSIIDKNKEKEELTVHTDSVNCIIKVPMLENKEYLASGSRDKTIKVFNMENNKLLYNFDKHEAAITCLNTLRIFKMTNLISSSYDYTVKLWNLDDGSLLSSFSHSDYVYSAIHLPKHYVIFSAGRDKTIRIWNTRTTECVDTIKTKSSVTNVYVTSRDKRLFLLASCDNGKVLVWKEIKPK
jgi:WD40 repeat protein